MELNKEEALQEVYRRISGRKFYRYKPYRWQEQFLRETLDHQELMLRAANRVGKTHTAAWLGSAFSTGEYPDWYEGKKFKRGTLGWVVSVTNETSRDITQKELLGEPIGTGLIPSDNILKVTYRQAGVSNVVDTVRIKNKTGHSQIVFKTQEQGWRKFQGAAPDWIWLDEEGDDFRVYTESLTRIMTSKGILFVTFTPLLGETDLVRHFNEGKRGTYVQTATWDDAEHLSREDKDRFIESFPEHERDARTKGVPMMGEGRVFSVDEKTISVTPFDIPPHFARICGIDFGIDHPAAGVWLAWDRDTDTVYIYDCYKKAKETATYHAQAIKKRGEWIPCAWPHDGVNKEKSGGRAIKDYYIENGVNMLGLSARYAKDKGGPQPLEPIVMEMLERMKTGRFYVFNHLSEFFTEFRNFHRKDGRIKSVRDDILKASMYGLMMKRYASPFNQPHIERYTRPIMSMRA
tara:strand:+ start:1816 stop:3201 length:1386 start_codon:yes stop_codon:yes gene_type:complete